MSLRVALSVVVAASAVALWLLTRWDVPWILQTGDEFEYAEVGRRLATGRGFTTGIVFPVEVAWGVDREHPSLLRPPLWSVVLAGAFAIGGAEERVAHLAVSSCFVATALAAFALGSTLAGPWAGLVAGVAAVGAADVRLWALFASTETLLAVWITLLFVLAARRCDPVWMGVVCALAYLTRYNAGLLLPVALALLVRRPLEIQPLLRCAMGFALVCAPWWLRNYLVTGEPLFSFQNLLAWNNVDLTTGNTSLLYALDPERAPRIHPLQKARALLALALTEWPLLTANLVAFGGVLLGCVRRERLCWGFAGAALLTKLVVIFFHVRGRYLVPFVPAMVALGTTAWMRHGGRFRVPALALVLLAPLLPTLPLHARDASYWHAAIEAVRSDVRAGDPPRNLSAFELDVAREFAACVPEGEIVLARNAHSVSWMANAVAIYMPLTERDFFTLVERHPIALVERRAPKTPGDRARLEARFEPLPDCGPQAYRRRDRATAPR